MLGVYMRITYEKTKSLSLIYIYLRPFDGIIADTISCVRSNLLFNEDKSWIGIEVYNDLFDNSKIDLPILNNPYTVIKNETVTLHKEGYVIYFDGNISVDSKQEVACNIDFNNVNGLQGIEFILEDFNADLDYIKVYNM